MPVYEYACKNCGRHFDKIQPITADPLTECVLCGKGPIRRVFQPVGVIFKGSGWYSTDNRSSNKSGGSSGSDAGSSSEAKPAASASSSSSSDGAEKPKADAPSTSSKPSGE